MNTGTYIGTDILSCPFGATLALIDLDRLDRRMVTLPNSLSSITDTLYYRIVMWLRVGVVGRCGGVSGSRGPVNLRKIALT